MRTYVKTKAGTCGIIRLRDIEHLVTNTYQDVWKSGKVCCPREDCVSKSLLFCCDGLCHHYRIHHTRVSCSDEQRIQGKDMLGKLVAAETLKNLSILFQKRLQQIRLMLFSKA